LLNQTLTYSARTDATHTRRGRGKAMANPWIMGNVDVVVIVNVEVEGNTFLLLIHKYFNTHRAEREHGNQFQ